MNIVLFGILAYVLVQFAVGIWVSRRMASEADYILAGRRLGVGLVTFSVFATYFGAEAIVASGGAVYEKGLAGALVDPIGYAAAIIIVGLLFARALWSRGLTHPAWNAWWSSCCCRARSFGPRPRCAPSARS
jgi:Na+/proline symporter